jgi:CheY-like chemotaxis protein
VVDDDVLILLHASDILADAGFRTLEASSAEEAVQLIDGEAGHVALLFTDVQMPGGMDGFALARQVAENWPDIQIVVASGRLKPEPGDMPAKGIFIGKPFSAKVVHDHLRQILPEGNRPEQLNRT